MLLLNFPVPCGHFTSFFPTDLFLTLPATQNMHKNSQIHTGILLPPQ